MDKEAVVERKEWLSFSLSPPPPALEDHFHEPWDYVCFRNWGNKCEEWELEYFSKVI